MCCARTAIVLLLAVLPAASRPADAAPPEANARPERAIRRSDVVFMYDNPKLYQTYGCTVLGWAGRADARHIQQAHALGVRLFACSVGFRTEGRGMIDFSADFLDAACRDFAGKPILVPWLWDDYTGTAGTVTWLSGCFCPHCMAAFREYLAGNVPKERLAELGITDLSKFDYRRFLLRKGVTPEQYRRRRASLSLAAEFLDFQVKAATDFVARYYKRAKELRGAPLTLCVNSGLGSPQALAIARHLSYFCCEVGHNAASRKPPTHPVYVYKLADGLDRPVTSTASGQDWAYVMEHKLPGLVRTWAAMSYAFGHTLMAPHRQWCYTREKGTHWYAGPTEEYAWLYQFVRKSARLLDRYEAVAPVAVVYDNAARRKGRGNIEPICAALAARNMPFTVVVAGDDWLDYRLHAARLARFKAVIVTKGPGMDAAQRKLIDRVADEGRLVTWPDDKRLEKLVPAPVVIEGSDRVWAVPRAIPGENTAPVVVHLLGRQYDPETDAVVPQKGLTLRLRRDLFPGRAFSKAMLHAPRLDPVPLDVATGDEYTTIKVPELGLWGIVELR
jgi:hypothetical protein